MSIARIGASSIVFALIFPLAAFAEDVVMKISYNEIHDRILPQAELTTTAVRLDVRLDASGSVQHNEARVSGSASGGGSRTIKLGANQGQAWKVAGPHELINIADYISYRRAILVTVNDKSCTAQVDYKLKPGFNDYRYHRLKNGAEAVARSVKANGLTCSIQ
jgi:hypothetical protein